MKMKEKKEAEVGYEVTYCNGAPRDVPWVRERVGGQRVETRRDAMLSRDVNLTLAGLAGGVSAVSGGACQAVARATLPATSQTGLQ